MHFIIEKGFLILSFLVEKYELLKAICVLIFYIFCAFDQSDSIGYYSLNKLINLVTVHRLI